MAVAGIEPTTLGLRAAASGLGPSRHASRFRPGHDVPPVRRGGRFRPVSVRLVTTQLSRSGRADDCGAGAAHDVGSEAAGVGRARPRPSAGARSRSTARRAGSREDGRPCDRPAPCALGLASDRACAESNLACKASGARGRALAANWCACSMPPTSSGWSTASTPGRQNAGGPAPARSSCPPTPRSLLPEASQPPQAVVVDVSMSSASPPRTSPMTMRSGRMRRALRTSARIDTGPRALERR